MLESRTLTGRTPKLTVDAFAEISQGQEGRDLSYTCIVERLWVAIMELLSQQFRQMA
jgi:hypothetical protein